MYALRLFGTPVLSGPDGPLAGRVAQRHPLAILALLASDPSGTVSREKLLGLLWPDRDTESARGVLNVALHALRKALGEGAIRSIGTSLQLDAGVVGCDVRAFAGAVAAGETERAVEVYAGPFLDGFYLDAEGFDRWAETERARLAGMYAEALERLGGEAERAGDAARAVGWWKRRAAHDPCDARVALRLMEAMAAAGDRAGALRHAAVHEALVRETLGAGPDPRIEALADRVRRGAEPAGASVSPPSPADEPKAPSHGGAVALPPVSSPEAAEATGRAGLAAAASADATLASRVRRRRSTRGRRVAFSALAVAAAAGVAGVWIGRASAPPAEPAAPSVAVLVFQPLRDTAAAGEETRDDYYGVGLADAIVTSLGRVSDIRVIAGSSSFAYQSGRADVREVGRKLGVTHVLEGTIRRHAGRLDVTVKLATAEDRRIRWSEEYRLQPADFVEVQRSIASRVAAALQGRDPAAATALAPLTRDPRAHEIYMQGRHAWYRRRPGGLLEAAAKFREAIARDSAFAEAYVGLAKAYSVMGGVEYGLMPARQAYREAVDAARRALELAPRSGEAHAVLANALVTYGGDWSQAELHFRRAIELDQGDADAWHWYAQGLLAAGRKDEATEALRRAQRLDPRSAVATAELGRNLYYERDFGRAAAEYRRAIEIDPMLASPHLGLGLIAVQTDSLDAAAWEFKRADTLLGGHPLSLALLAHAEARRGRTGAARGLLARIEAMSRQGRYVAPEYLAIAHLGLGEHDQALRLLERASAENPGLGLALRLEPLADPLRSHPRFARLLAHIQAAR